MSCTQSGPYSVRDESFHTVHGRGRAPAGQCALAEHLRYYRK